MVMMRKVARSRYGRVASRRVRRSERARWSGRRGPLGRARSTRFFLAKTTRHVAGRDRATDSLVVDWLAAGGTMIAAASWGVLLSLLG